MSKEHRDYLTKNLPFRGDEEPPRPGEKGYLLPGRHFDENGNIVDDEGNIYDEADNLVKAVPSSEWTRAMRRARRQHPDWDDKELRPLAMFYYKEDLSAAKRKKNKT